MLQQGEGLTARAPAATGRGSLRRLLVSIGIANAALYALYVGVLQVLLPLQVEGIDRAHKVATLGLVSGVSAGVAAVCNPLGGTLSDRTRSRYGRRVPWLTDGAAAAVAALAVLGRANSVLMVVVGWSLVQAAANLYQAALTAVVPDRVPARKRGAASAVVGVAMSDRLGRRKIFVIGSAALSGAAMILPVLSPTFVTMTVFAAVAGLAFGCYLAVDTALVTLVLPRADDTARDMGVLNVANAGPQIIAPFLAAVIIGHLGGYPALFVGSGAIAIAGALAIGPVRSVR